MSDTDKIRDAVERLKRLDDFTVSASETARSILDYLGIGSDVSLEPGDRRRDKIAWMIEAHVAARRDAALAEVERLKGVLAEAIAIADREEEPRPASWKHVRTAERIRALVAHPSAPAPDRGVPGQRVSNDELDAALAPGGMLDEQGSLFKREVGLDLRDARATHPHPDTTLVRELANPLSTARDQVVAFMLECGYAPETATENVEPADALLTRPDVIAARKDTTS